MVSNNLVRAWKDEEYRLSLGEAELALLPANPAGTLELTDAELELADGGLCLVSGINVNLTGFCVAINLAVLFAIGQQNQISGIAVGGGIITIGAGQENEVGGD